MGLTVFAALVANGAGLGAALTATYGAIGSALIQVGASLLLTRAANAILSPKQRPQDIARQLAQPSSAPDYRFVYGETAAVATPITYPVRGDYIWGCWLLNSRPSDLAAFTLYLDEREVPLEGDPFDFAGPGALSTDPLFRGDNDDILAVWIGRGDQTAPPATFLADAPWAPGGDEELWKASDAFQGLTVLYLRINAGNAGKRLERWPNYPPQPKLVGRWSRVWDPRDLDQDPDDPASWTYSANHALVTLDLLRQNPVRQYQLKSLVVESFAAAADISDETVTLKSGGSEPRYTVGGTLTFSDSEIEDQVAPVLRSGAADLFRTGGRLGLVPGAWAEPVATVTEFLGDGVEIVDLQPGDRLINQRNASYLAPERGYDLASLAPWSAPGALDADGGLPRPADLELSFCTSATQAMRVRKIVGLRDREQARITAPLPPETFELVGGAVATLSLPAPFDIFDGDWRVLSIDPGLDPLGSSGVALRMTAELALTSAAVFAWDPATDEEDVVIEAYDGTRSGVIVPGAIAVVTGDAANLDTGGTVLPRIRFAFDPSPSGGVLGYDWRYRITGEAYWETGGAIDADVRDGAGQVFGYLTGTAGTSYDIGVRTSAQSGQSDWRGITGVTMLGPDLTPGVPTDGTATGGAGQIDVSFRAPNDPAVEAVEIWGADSEDSATAALLITVYCGPNALVEVSETDLGPAVTRFYFARTRGAYASASAFTEAVTATTDP